MPDIGAAAGQAVLKILIALQVVTPRPAPEGLGDGASFNENRGDRMALLAQPLHLARGLSLPLRNRNVGRPIAIEFARHWLHSAITAFRSRATKRSRSASFISVRLISSPLASTSSDKPFFASIKASILSSTVPWQTNLWTSTFFF